MSKKIKKKIYDNVILYLPVDGHKNILFRTADKVADKTLLNILVIYKKNFVCVQKKGK